MNSLASGFRDAADLEAALANYTGTGAVPEKNVLTLMFRGVPRSYTTEQLIHELDAEGLQGTYDFVYVPWDKSRRFNVSYAFASFINSESALRCFLRFSDRPWSLVASDKVCQISSARIQGLNANLEHLLKSNGLPTDEMPHEPFVFMGGLRVTLKSAVRALWPLAQVTTGRNYGSVKPSPLKKRLIKDGPPGLELPSGLVDSETETTATGGASHSSSEGDHTTGDLWCSDDFDMVRAEYLRPAVFAARGLPAQTNTQACLINDRQMYSATRPANPNPAKNISSSRDAKMEEALRVLSDSMAKTTARKFAGGANRTSMSRDFNNSLDFQSKDEQQRAPAWGGGAVAAPPRMFCAAQGIVMYSVPSEDEVPLTKLGTHFEQRLLRL